MRPVVTYVAAAYLFVFIPLFVGIAACAVEEQPGPLKSAPPNPQAGEGGDPETKGESNALASPFELSDSLRELLLLPVPLAGAIITYWFATRPTDKHLDRVLDRFAQAAENAATQAKETAAQAKEAAQAAENAATQAKDAVKEGGG